MKTAQRDDWVTPRPFFLRLHEEFRFTIDAAASDDNHRLPRYWTEQEDALAQDWRGERVFCNPPFSKKAAFAHKAATGGADLVVMILPSSTEQKWYHESVLGKAAEVRFIRGRILFEPPPGVAAASPRFASIVAVYHYIPPAATLAVSMKR